MNHDYISPSDEKDAALAGAAAESLLAMTRTVAANAKVLAALEARNRGEPSDILGTATAAIEATRESSRAIAFERKCIEDATS